jgi:predicted metalloprotease with PDZ domain
VWGRAGLHTGDRLVSVNGVAYATWREYRAMLTRVRIGDTLRYEVARDSGPFRTTVVVTGFDRPEVRIEEMPGATERQRAIRARWASGAP